MDAKLINDAFLNGWTVEVWRTYIPSFGDNLFADEIMGSGKIMKHTAFDIMLDDGQYYPKAGAELRIRQKNR